MGLRCVEFNACLVGLASLSFIREGEVQAMDGLPTDEILRVAEAAGASNVRVFGSRARGDARPDSDLDLLMTFARGTTLFDLARLKRTLEERLGIRVDILTEGSLHPLLRERILAEAQPLVAA